MSNGFRMAGDAMEGPHHNNNNSSSKEDLRRGARPGTRGWQSHDYQGPAENQHVGEYWQNRGNESAPADVAVNSVNTEMSDWTRDQYINTRPLDPASINEGGGGPPKSEPEPEPDREVAPEPAPAKDTMYNFGAHDTSVHGDGYGFGQEDLDWMLDRGAKEENIKKYMHDYQNTGGRVGKRAAAWAGMEDSQDASLESSDPSRGMGSWWRDREGGSSPIVNYDYSLHDSEAHGGTGIGKADIEAMRRGGANNENIKKYIRDYARQGGIVGSVAASYGGVKENMTTPGEAFIPGANLGEWWSNRDRSNGIGMDPDKVEAPKAPADSTGSGAGNISGVTGSGGGNQGGGAGGQNIALSGDAFTRKWGGSFRNNTSGLETANKYIQYAKDHQVWDNKELDKRIEGRPQYHQAKGDVYQSEWGGDMWKGNVPEWTMPEALNPIKAPDLDPQKYLDLIKDMGD